MIANRGTGTPAGRDPRPGKEISGDIEGNAVQTGSVNGGVYFIRPDSRTIPVIATAAVIIAIIVAITYLLRTNGTPRTDQPPAPVLPTPVTTGLAPTSSPAPSPPTPRLRHAVPPRPRTTSTTTTPPASPAPPVSPSPPSPATDPRTEPTTTTTTPETSTTTPGPTPTPALLA